MRWKLFYDGGCNLCHRSQLRVEKWAQSYGQPLEVDVLASDEAIAKNYGDMMVLEADQVYFGADAWLKLMTISPWYLRWMGFLGGLPGIKRLMAWGYDVVAKNRKRWFGTRACPIPPRSGEPSPPKTVSR